MCSTSCFEDYTRSFPTSQGITYDRERKQAGELQALQEKVILASPEYDFIFRLAYDAIAHYTWQKNDTDSSYFHNFYEAVRQDTMKNVSNDDYWIDDPGITSSYLLGFVQIYLTVPLLHWKSPSSSPISYKQFFASIL